MKIKKMMGVYAYINDDRLKGQHWITELSPFSVIESDHMMLVKMFEIEVDCE